MCAIITRPSNHFCAVSRPCIVSDGATGINVNPALIVVNPRLISSSILGVNIQPELIQVQPDLIKVKPVGVNVSPTGISDHSVLIEDVLRRCTWCYTSCISFLSDPIYFPMHKTQSLHERIQSDYQLHASIRTTH